MEVDYLGYVNNIQRGNQQRLSDLQAALAQVQQNKRQAAQDAMAQQEASRRATLADLQIGALKRENEYQQGLEGAMSNPRTLTSLTQGPVQTMPSLASLGGPSFGPETPQYNGPMQPGMTQQTRTQSPAEAGAKYAMSKGRTEDAAKFISLDDTVAQMGAKLQATGGDLTQYYAAKAALDEGKAFLNEVIAVKDPVKLKALWPQFQAAFPKQASLINPDDIKFQQSGVVVPMVTSDGKPVPGKGVYQDADGKTHMVDLTPKEEPETWGPEYLGSVGGKKVLKQKSSRGMVRTVAQDVSTTVVNHNGESGTGPVAQSTFVDQATGKPLVFDKKTGTYRIATVEGTATPKPAAFSPESAAKTQMIEQAIGYMPTIRELVMPGGKVDRTNVGNMTAGTFFTEGRKAKTYVLDAVEAKLRAESGAAVPEPEVKRAAKRFIPNPGDSDDQIKVKLDNLEAYLKGTSQKINQGRPQAPDAPKPAQGKGKVQKIGKYTVEVH